MGKSCILEEMIASGRIRLFMTGLMSTVCMTNGWKHAEAKQDAREAAYPLSQDDQFRSSGSSFEGLLTPGQQRIQERDGSIA